MEKYNVVLDTNIVLVSISRNSPHHWVFEKLIAEEFIICVSTEILLEYEEVIERHLGPKAAYAVMGIFDNLNKIQRITTYFEFDLLDDPDDNKFVNCSVAANADFIVSHDRGFQKLKQINFPSIEVIDLEEFKSKMS